MARSSAVLGLLSLLLQNVDLLGYSLNLSSLESISAQTRVCCNTAVPQQTYIATHWPGMLTTACSVIIVHSCERATSRSDVNVIV